MLAHWSLPGTYGKVEREVGDLVGMFEPVSAACKVSTNRVSLAVGGLQARVTR